MLTPKRALALSIDSGRPLPRVDGLEDLYRLGGGSGVTPRHGEVMMIAGRSGSQKSGFALWYVDSLDLPALYFSADMSPATASARVASLRAGLTTEEVEYIMSPDGNPAQRAELEDLTQGSKIHFSFGNPIRWSQVDRELEAFVELHYSYPEVVVFDNLMDFDGADSEYAEQMAVMQDSTALSREIGAATIVMHHASDKGWDARKDPFKPPSRDQVKGGLSEKPALSLSVSLDPDSLEFRIACLKQRGGPSDPTAKRYATLIAQPQYTRFHNRRWRG